MFWPRLMKFINDRRPSVLRQRIIDLMFELEGEREESRKAIKAVLAARPWPPGQLLVIGFSGVLSDAAISNIRESLRDMGEGRRAILLEEPLRIKEFQNMTIEAPA